MARAVDTPVWCSSTLKCTDSFRGMVYKINPYNLACVYKRMFESRAISTLRNFDIDWNGTGDDGENTPAENAPMEMAVQVTAPTPTSLADITCPSIGGQQAPKHYWDALKATSAPVHSRRSCSSPAPATGSYRQTYDKSHKNKEIQGWQVCSRPHTAVSYGYQRFTIAESRDYLRHRSHSACPRKSANTRHFSDSACHRLAQPRKSANEKNCKSCCSAARFHASSPIDTNNGARDKVIDDNSGSNISSSSGTSQNNSHSTGTHSKSPHPTTAPHHVVQIQYGFKHFRESEEYMDQYRDEYTYKRLCYYKPTCTCDNRTLNSIVAVGTPLFRWFDSFYQKAQNATGSLKTRTGSADPETRKKARTPTIRKRVAKPPTPDSARKSQHLLLAQNGILKLEFYTNPLANNSTLRTTSSIVKKPTVCRSRPTIPSNARGAICPSSTGTNAYVIHPKSKPKRGSKQPSCHNLEVKADPCPVLKPNSNRNGASVSHACHVDDDSEETSHDVVQCPESPRCKTQTSHYRLTRGTEIC